MEVKKLLISRGPKAELYQQVIGRNKMIDERLEYMDVRCLRGAIAVNELGACSLLEEEHQSRNLDFSDNCIWPDAPTIVRRR